MIDLAAVAARINALEGWDADEVDEAMGHHVTVVKEREWLQAVVMPDGTVDSMGCFGNLMVWLPVLQIVAEAMASE